MSTRMRGNAGEAAVLNALVQRGLDVFVPFGGGHAYDLLLDLHHRGFVRIQCKTAWPSRGCLVFNCLATDHGRGRTPYIGLADVFGVYFPPREAVYLVPMDAVARFEGRLRLEPTRNNQRRGVRFAADFEIDRWTVEALADLAPTNGSLVTARRNSAD